MTRRVELRSLPAPEQNPLKPSPSYNSLQPDAWQPSRSAAAARHPTATEPSDRQISPDHPRAKGALRSAPANLQLQWKWKPPACPYSSLQISLSAFHRQCAVA